MRSCKEYLLYKKKLKAQEFVPRVNCDVCGFAKKTCYCHKVKKFDSKITFAILIHQLEIDRKIATGTLSHLILSNSHLIAGFDYSQNQVVNDLINDSHNYCVVLYPGKHSTNLTELTSTQKVSLVPYGKQLVIFVIDGTWRTAKQTMRISKNLNKLPLVTFNSSTPSSFRVRKQPSLECCSTVEAIHQSITLLGESQGFDVNSRAHDNLLDVFNFMVETQISMMS